MFPLQNHHQSIVVYGPDIYTKLLSKDHILYKINQQIDFSFVNCACKNLYSQDNGRPVKNRMPGFTAPLSRAPDSAWKFALQRRMVANESETGI